VFEQYLEDVTQRQNAVNSKVKKMTMLSIQRDRHEDLMERNKKMVKDSITFYENS
jgi:hypothetical protein